MRHSIRNMLALVVLLAFVPSAHAAPEKYNLQKDQSVVGFTWLFGKDEVQGQMPVADADVVIDLARPENSKVAVSLDVSGAKAGFLFATQALKGPKVLWAQKYPEISFVSETVRSTSDGVVIDGAMTIRGVTLPATMEASLYRQRGTQEGDLRLLSFVVRGSVSRSAFGADGWSDAVGDKVAFTIQARIERDD